MVLPDFLIRLLEILHLKDSEEKKLKKRIAQCDENIRSLNQGLENQKTQYDTASGAVRETLAVRMKNILKQRERMSEQRQMAAQQMNAEMLVRHNLVLQLEHRQHPDNHDLEEIRDEKMDIIDDLKEQAKTIEQLESTTLKKTEKIDEDFDKALQAAEDEFKDVDLSFSAPKPEKKEAEKEKDEA